LLLSFGWQDFDEYPNWEKYRLTFSCYETDEEYVKYGDELSKKMKVCIVCLPIEKVEKHVLQRNYND